MKYYFVILFALLSGRVFAQDTVTGKVIRIIDGDTFEALMDRNVTERIRLHGIDCPEPNQPFSNTAKDKLAKLIFSKQVKFLRLGVDHYGRTIAIVLVNSLNVNEALLRAGLAWHFKRYDHNPSWDALEKQAARERVGLWADARPVPPWNWRKSSRRK